MNSVFSFARRHRHALVLLLDIGECCFELLAVGADDMQRRAERCHLVDAGATLKRFSHLVEPRALHDKGG